ncbi:MAG: CpaF family protein [Thermoanaerobacterales bacterium]|nr:CpaF family protein [Thermoanaerobacterales bacterium]
MIQKVDYALLGTLAVRDGMLQMESESVSNDKEEIIDRDNYERLKSHVQELVRQQFSLADTANVRTPVVRSKFKTIAENAMRNLGIQVTEADMHILVQKLFDDILGYGVLEKYFFDPEITDIIVNNTEIRVIKKGKRMIAEDRFEDTYQAHTILDRMLAPTGRKIDSSTPRVNARLFDGSRLHACVAPAAVDGILITIRRFPEAISVDTLIKNGTLSKKLLEFLRACVVARQSVVISGGTGSGKTTLINAIGSFIPYDESIITIEDTAELQIQHPDVRRMEARTANIEGKGQITLRDLVQDALRMIPDRIIVGECRGEEAFDMLQAMNTGHDGSLTTVHANSAQECINRLLTLTQMASMGLEQAAIYEIIAGAVDIIVHVGRDRTGQRKILEIAEVAGTDEHHGVKLNTLWKYDRKNKNWKWVAKDFIRKKKLIEDGGWKCSL